MRLLCAFFNSCNSNLFTSANKEDKQKKKEEKKPKSDDKPVKKLEKSASSRADLNATYSDRIFNKQASKDNITSTSGLVRSSSYVQAKEDTPRGQDKKSVSEPTIELSEDTLQAASSVPTHHSPSQPIAITPRGGSPNVLLEDIVVRSLPSVLVCAILTLQ